MPTDDERLLAAEATRALGRLRRVRDRIEELREAGLLSSKAAKSLREAGEFDRVVG
jgi:hypothetical protein